MKDIGKGATVGTRMYIPTSCFLFSFLMEARRETSTLCVAGI